MGRGVSSELSELDELEEESSELTELLLSTGLGSGKGASFSGKLALMTDCKVAI